MHGPSPAGARSGRSVRTCTCAAVCSSGPSCTGREALMDSVLSVNIWERGRVQELEKKLGTLKKSALAVRRRWLVVVGRFAYGAAD